jgi:hypothetical protein
VQYNTNLLEPTLSYDENEIFKYKEMKFSFSKQVKYKKVNSVPQHIQSNFIRLGPVDIVQQYFKQKLPKSSFSIHL